MKKILLVFVLFNFLACTTAQKPETNLSSYNHIEDIKLFLSTKDKIVENQVLDRLKLNGIIRIVQIKMQWIKYLL